MFYFRFSKFFPVWSCFLIVGASASLTITSISPLEGGTHGGTRLTLFGEGFAEDKYDVAYTVLIGNHQCNVLEYYTSHTQVVCETPQVELGTRELVTLTATDSLATHIASRCCFEFSGGSDVVVQAIRPQAGPPGTVVRFSGERGSFGIEVTDFGAVAFGDTLCEIEEEDAVQWVRQKTYELQCQLATGLMAAENLTMAQQSGALTEPLSAGSLNLTMRMADDWSGELAYIHPDNRMVDLRGKLYHFQIHPEMTSVDPAIGSVAGGTVLTITGAGLPASLDAAAELTIEAGGVPCDVVQSTSAEVQCVTHTAPQEGLGELCAVILDGIAYYPGGRGVNFTWWSNFTGSLDKWRDALGGSGVDEEPLEANSSWVVTDALQDPLDKEDFYVSRMRTLFLPPVTGPYTFYVSGDDQVEVRGASCVTEGGWGDTALEELCEVPGWTQWRVWDKYAEQEAAPRELRAGVPYLLEVLHRNYAGMSSAAVGVRMPGGSAPQPNSVSEVQRIATAAPSHGQTQTLRALGLSAVGSLQLVTIEGPTSACSPTAVGFLLYLDGHWTELLRVNSSAQEVEAALEVLPSVHGLNATVQQLEAAANSCASYSVEFHPALGAVALIEGFVEAATARTVAPSVGGVPPASSAESETGAGNATHAPTALEGAASQEMRVVVDGVREGSPGLTGSFWLFDDPADFMAGVQLAHDASASAVQQAVMEIGELDAKSKPPVVVREWFEDGLGHSGWQWLVQYPYAEEGMQPAPLLIDPLGEFPFGLQGGDVVAYANVTRAQSAPIDGEVGVSMAGSNTVFFAHNATSAQVRAALHELPTVGQVLVVAEDATLDGTRSWEVVFEPMSNPGGDLPLMVADAQRLGGTPGAAVVVTEEQAGSLDIIARPIPGDYLRVPEASPDALRFTVAGVPASCRASPRVGGCRFQHDAAVTPRVHRASPEEAVPGAILTLAGSGLAAEQGQAAVVSLGTAECVPVGAPADGEVRCTLGQGEAGWHEVRVVVPGLGAAAHPTNTPVRVRLDSLAVTAASPTEVAAEGATMVTLTGTGFAAGDCDRHVVHVGSSACIPYVCGATELLCRLDADGTAGTHDVTLQLLAIDTAAFPPELATLAQGLRTSLGDLPRASAVTPSEMSTGGGVVHIFGQALHPASAAIFLRPEGAGGVARRSRRQLLQSDTDTGDETPLSEVLFAGAEECALVADLSSPSELVCEAGASAVAGASFEVLVTVGDAEVTVVAPGAGAALLRDLTLTAVSPRVGSLAGGTRITVTGTGFAPEAGLNAVFTRVPVSTTFPNGVVPCDVEQASETEIVCVTRPHCAADASAADPYARRCEHAPTPESLLEVAACPENLTTALGATVPVSTALGRLRCWAEPGIATARCAAAEGRACTFAYTASSTPTVASVAPQVVATSATEVLTMVGENFPQDMEVRLMPVNTADTALRCAIGDGAGTTSTELTCSVPGGAAPGMYHVEVYNAANGEGGIARMPVVFAASVMSVELSSGSMAGGAEVTLRGGGAGFHGDSSQHTMSVGGMPWRVLRSSGSELVCESFNVTGRLAAAYYVLEQGTRSLPALAARSPDATGYVNAVHSDWVRGGPEELGTVADYFGVSYSGYIHVAELGEYWFSVVGDDESAVWVNGRAVWHSELDEGTEQQAVDLSVGYHELRVDYLEAQGRAHVSLKYRIPGAVESVPVPEEAFFLVRPETPLAVELSVNGVPAALECSSESTSGTGGCSYTYAASSTPHVAEVLPLEIRDGGERVTLRGALFGSAPDDNWARIGGGECIVVAVQRAPAPPSGGSAGEPDGGMGNGTALPPPPGNLRRHRRLLQPSGASRLEPTAEGHELECIAPTLPAGTYPVRAGVRGRGAALGEHSLVYPLGVTAVSPAAGSAFGGVHVTVTGLGFPEEPYNRTAVTLAVAFGEDSCEVLSSTATSLVCRTADPGAEGVGETRRVDVTVSSALGGHMSARGTWSEAAFEFSASAAPVILEVAPPTLAPHAEATELLVTWQPPPGMEVSLQSLEVKVAGRVCARREASASQITCAAPSLPAGSHPVRLWAGGTLGFSAAYTVDVPLEVSGMAPEAGSAAGGQAVTVAGAGFDVENSTQNEVTIGGSTCAVLNVSSTRLVCLTPAQETYGQREVWARTLSMPEPTLVGTYQVEETLTAVISWCSPTRGSTEGGTLLTISGDRFGNNPTALKVLVGDAPCSSITLVTPDTTLTCITSKPVAGAGAAPAAVMVYKAGGASELATAGARQGGVWFQYVDLWSRSSTWGGADPPAEGDSVYIPAGVTVLLDVSPPRLVALFVEGTLQFDDNRAQLHLAASYILVHKGGHLVAGTAEAPYPAESSASITLHGDMESPELPTYGAKVLAVRDGAVDLHGSAREPTWTRLDRTVHPGDTELELADRVSWRPGDRVVVASSSFLAHEVDEARVTRVEALPAGGSRVTLATPLRYTHLGVVAQFGDAGSVDMRAEVGVLTRNVLLQGDAGHSEAQQYGAHVLVHDPVGGACSNRPASDCAAPSAAALRMRHVEMRRCGQAFRLGRYCIHFHMHGDASASYVASSVVHGSFNRAVALHGTHRCQITRNVAYDVKGHTFFVEDGVEMENVFEGNLGILTRKSHSLLNTDTTPATFWITNPDNVVRDNVAAGSEAYGFWYRLLEHPEGAAHTEAVCPKRTPLREFSGNSAHSNLRYGLRIFEEYYPEETPCKSWQGSPIQAEFANFTAYKNGMKGAIATQVGEVVFRDFRVADCGAGPAASAAKVNGKDHGGGLEMTWVVDGRARSPHAGAPALMDAMAGIDRALVVARSEEGREGTAGAWNTGRGLRGVITQTKSSRMKVRGVTFWGWSGGQFFALEACGKCKFRQGGFTTHVAHTRFAGPGSDQPAIATWSWSHQGILLDMDGSLVGDQACARLGGAWCGTEGGLPGATLVAAHGLLLPEECDDTDTAFPGAAAGGSAVCRPGLVHRRVMINGHKPSSVIKFYNLNVSRWQDGALRMDSIPFSKYNDQGYQFTVVAGGRDYELSWATPYRVDPRAYQAHDMEALEVGDAVFLHTHHLNEEDHFYVNGGAGSAAFPPTTAPHGAHFYQPNRTYNPVDRVDDTVHTVLLRGNASSRLKVEAFICPDAGCPQPPPAPIGYGNVAGVVYWSDESTWRNHSLGRMPQAGDDVDIPEDMRLVLDLSTPVLNAVRVQGELYFADPALFPVPARVEVALRAVYVVADGGAIVAGIPGLEYNHTALIELHGQRDTPQWALSNDANLGAKVLAAVARYVESVDGARTRLVGQILLHGRPILRRWTRLAASAAAGSETLALAQPVDWSRGQEVVVTSASWNPHEAEVAVIRRVLSGGLELELEAPLKHDHKGVRRVLGGGVDTPEPRELVTHAEVGLLSAEILVRAADGEAQHAGWRPGGESAAAGCHAGGEARMCGFGARVAAYGAGSTLHLRDVAVWHGGQAGLERPAVLLQDVGATSSYIERCALAFNLDSAVGVAGDTRGARLAGNVAFESVDRSTVLVTAQETEVVENLALGTVKLAAGKSGFDNQLPATFEVGPMNMVSHNVAAGSDRIGMRLAAEDCAGRLHNDSDSGGSGEEARSAGHVRDNTAHASLVGVLLEASGGGVCSGAPRTVVHHCWDFGVLAGLQGLAEDVLLEDAMVADTRHAGVLILRKGTMTEQVEAAMRGGALVGASATEECRKCAVTSDPGCHPNLSRQSYARAGYPGGSPSYGLISSTFATAFTPGPEHKPWDGLKGYPTIHGVMRVTGVRLASFGPDAGSCGAESFAIANHAKAPDAFHPHYFSGMTREDVPDQGLLRFHDADPSWRNPSDCGTDVYDSSHPLAYYDDEDAIGVHGGGAGGVPLNCDGPRHIYFQDVDGSLLGSPGTLLGALAHQPRPQVEQGTPYVDAACDAAPPWSAVKCVAGRAGESRPAGPGRPVAGVFADPQLVVLESRDADSEDRNVSPAKLVDQGTGAADLLVSAMDHGWCFGYTCQKRLSTFWSVVSSGEVYSVNFTGTPPRVLRVWFPYAAADAEVVLHINYFEPNRRYVWTEEAGRVDPSRSLSTCLDATGQLADPSCIPSIGDGTRHGAFFWHQLGSMLYVKVRGGQHLEVRTEPVIMVSATLALSIDDFYAERYVENVAYVLGIDPSRIKVASVVAGSVVLQFNIEASQSEVAGLQVRPRQRGAAPRNRKVFVSAKPPVIDATWAMLGSPVDATWGSARLSHGCHVGQCSALPWMPRGAVLGSPVDATWGSARLSRGCHVGQCSALPWMPRGAVGSARL
ncbi:hypothetical protein CYMTET_32501, partial [Cymbomonas tetramitiformis]